MNRRCGVGNLVCWNYRLVVSDASLFVGREEGVRRSCKTVRRGSFLSSCDTADLMNWRATPSWHW